MIPTQSDPAHTIHELLAVQAEALAQRPAISAPGRTNLTYAGLLEVIKAATETFHKTGLGRNSRISIVLPNGPEMAAAFLSVTAAASAAPLNPGYRLDEFRFYLSDAQVEALIVPADSDSPAIQAAAELGIKIIRLTAHPDLPAGTFTLEAETAPSPSDRSYAQPDDIALLLHTSGTTARPKLVPLTQHNILASAFNIQKSLALTPKDRCLNIMPLFHVHGLMGALMSSMSAGASVICTPGFYAPEFFKWMQEGAPTWYTAVPTMHQSILQRAPDNQDIIDDTPLRFIRSSSASLAPNLIRELETLFHSPALEAYGMTEAAHQMSVNPLPPGVRKPGSVGLAFGTEIAIMGDDDAILPPNHNGAIVIRGPGVMAGYEHNPEANQSAFTGGWFRTGDEGRLDEDGYLFITGRIKEIINRGGEKISPREIDEALLTHPDIQQAVAFAVPDPRLGEEVAAAIILAEGASLTERQIQDYAAMSLADFKVPRHIMIVDQIPVGPTGKLQRIGLAEKLGLGKHAPSMSNDARFEAPRTDIEQTLLNIWAEVLGLDRISIHDHFLDLGGDSVLATRIVSRIRYRLTSNVTIRDFFDSPTVAEMAAIIETAMSPG